MEVGILTIGDELLSGDTVNTNAAWLGRQLSDKGVDVSEVVLVSDSVDHIAPTINDYRTRFDAVIVTGGLGPTHDDLTIEAVARAFDRQLVKDASVIEWLEQERGYEASNLTPNTALIPEGSIPLHNAEGVAPGIHVENVYVLPGVPAEMKSMFADIADNFEGTDRFTGSLLIDEPESQLVDRINQLRGQFDVDVGSYPGINVRIRVIGEDQEEVTGAIEWLRGRVKEASSEEGVQPEYRDD